MIRDEDLRSSLDYNEGQKEAAHRVLVELVNLFNEYQDVLLYGKVQEDFSICHKRTEG